MIKDIIKRKGAYLPHWTKDEAVYAVTFRLADALPQPIIKAWMNERNNIEATAKQLNRPLSIDEKRRLHELHSDKIETFLDSGHGICWFKRKEIAQILKDSLYHFLDQRYELYAWSIMPNHIHLLLKPVSGFPLPKIIHSIKSFSALSANRIIGRSGKFWQDEYYDHLIRDEDDLYHAYQYIINNPRKAKLDNWPWIGCDERFASLEDY